jgi:hypothetical protein
MKKIGSNIRYRSEKHGLKQQLLTAPPAPGPMVATTHADQASGTKTSSDMGALKHCIVRMAAGRSNFKAAQQSDSSVLLVASPHVRHLPPNLHVCSRIAHSRALCFFE